MLFCQFFFIFSSHFRKGKKKKIKSSFSRIRKHSSIEKMKEKKSKVIYNSHCERFFVYLLLNYNTN